ncbi:MAG: hypothetical protein JW793_02945 [Acidobacteria bacterium]|nr:hypothetical protein [Acidobacteriota bacterium]
MRHIDLSVCVSEVVMEMNNSGRDAKPSVQLSIPADISGFRCKGNDLEQMMKRFLSGAVAASQPEESVQVEITEKAKMKGLESFFAFSPLRWVHCSIVFQAVSKFTDPAKFILRDLGYRCLEWIGGEDSDDQLGAYCRDSGEYPEIILYLSRWKTRVRCDLLIPVVEHANRSASRFRSAACPENPGCSDTL